MCRRKGFQWENLGEDRYVLYLDYSDGSTGIYMCQNMRFIVVVVNFMSSFLG